MGGDKRMLCGLRVCAVRQSSELEGGLGIAFFISSAKVRVQEEPFKILVKRFSQQRVIIEEGMGNWRPFS